jgi:hypothetical protein
MAAARVARHDARTAACCVARTLTRALDGGASESLTP